MDTIAIIIIIIIMGLFIGLAAQAISENFKMSHGLIIISIISCLLLSLVFSLGIEYSNKDLKEQDLESQQSVSSTPENSIVSSVSTEPTDVFEVNYIKAKTLDASFVNLNGKIVIEKTVEIDGQTITYLSVE